MHCGISSGLLGCSVVRLASAELMSGDPSRCSQRGHHRHHARTPARERSASCLPVGCRAITLWCFIWGRPRGGRAQHAQHGGSRVPHRLLPCGSHTERERAPRYTPMRPAPVPVPAIVHGRAASEHATRRRHAPARPSLSLSSSVAALWKRVSYHAYTLVLFTIADFKTIFLPIVRTPLRASPCTNGTR